MAALALMDQVDSVVGHHEANASDAIMRRPTPTAERTLTSDKGYPSPTRNLDKGLDP